ncbi:hypothetical protein GCM10010341_87510 [Streptomyces noursei]|nr:hypothetical protein GCM10010341_87510 [Streptomyces noursei]
MVEEAYSQCVFRQARGGDGHGEDEADGVGEDAPLPTIFLAMSVPWLVTGTLVEVLMLWVSITAPNSASTSTSYRKTHRSKDSQYYHDAG